MKTIITVFVFVSAVYQTLSAQTLVIRVADEVDLGMASYIERAVAEAESRGIPIILHINTFGGRVDAAVRIRDAIIAAKVPLTVSFIDKRAISAGALIALSCKKIAMAPGSSFGAVTPVDGMGTKASEKVVSYMRAEMRATAERNGRDPEIAQAMVDESVAVDSSHGIVVDTGRLLTLTSADAKKVGYADLEAESIDDVIKALSLPASVEHSDEIFSDKLIRFLTLPLISSILIIIGLGGLFYTIKTGHIGSITAASVIALAIYFGGQYITEVAPTIAAILFIVGIGLLIAEIFIPSFGIIGISGILCVFGGLFLSLAGDFDHLTPERLHDTLVSLAVSIVGVFLAAGIMFKYAPGWPMLRRLVNQTISGDMTNVIHEHQALLGKSGLSLTPLRPAGTAMIEGKKIDVITRGEFIQAGSPVVVIDVTGNRTVVEQSK